MAASHDFHRSWRTGKRRARPGTHSKGRALEVRLICHPLVTMAPDIRQALWWAPLFNSSELAIDICSCAVNVRLVFAVILVVIIPLLGPV